MFPNHWPQRVWPGGHLFSCQSPPRPCISIRCFFVQYSESCETCPRIWQFSISINVPIVIDAAFLHNIQVRISGPGNVDILQWNRKWFFSRHVQFNSGFHVMTVHKIAWDGPEVISSITIIPRWVSNWCWRRSVWFSLKIALFFSQYELFTTQWRQHCIECFRVDSSCVHLFQFLNVCDQSVSFPDSSRVQRTSKENFPGKTFGPNWCSRDRSSAEIGWYSTIAPNRTTGPLNGTSNRLSYCVFPSDKRSWMFRR